MSDILCIATIILAGIAQASLQLGLGGLILLYHNSMGKHRRRRTRHLARNYILGVSAISFLSVCAIGFLVSNIFNSKLTTEWLVICSGALAACGIVMWLLYYRRGKNSTELWLPKPLVRFIRKKARSTDDNVEAFSLGLLSGFAEMPFSVAIYFIAANSLLNLNANLQLIALIGFTLLSAVPMIVLKIRIKSGKSAVEAQKWRLRNKAFSRVVSGSSFMLLAMFVLAFWVMK